MRGSIFKKVAALTLLSLPLLSSCGSHWLTKDNREIINEAMTEMVRGLNEADPDVIKGCFQDSVIEKFPDFDERVDALIDYVERPIVSHEIYFSGGEEASIGPGGTNERVIINVDYRLHSENSDYKINFEYRSYCTDENDDLVPEMIGFSIFDIINAADDWPESEDPYSGCCYGYEGINIGYKDIVGLDFETQMRTAYYNEGGAFDHFIANSPEDLEKFAADSGSTYDLAKNEEGDGYLDIIGHYDEAFFLDNSLLVLSFYDEQKRFSYTPQWLYIDDYVYSYVCGFEPDEEYSPRSLECKGAIFFIDMIHKLPNDARIEIEFEDRR